MLSWLVPVVVSASVAIVVAILTPAFVDLQRRRSLINDRFDCALSALLRVQASRHIANSIDQKYHPGTDEEWRAFNVRMTERTILTFVDETVSARNALVAIETYVPEVRSWVTSGWELQQGAEASQREVIQQARNSAVTSERLFRSRRVTSVPPVARASENVRDISTAAAP